MKYDAAPIYVLAYDRARDIFERCARLPRPHRPVLGLELQRTSFDLLEAATAALLRPEEREIRLQSADDARLRLRLALRLTRDLHLFPPRQHDHASSRLTEAGRMLGGWRRTWTGRMHCRRARPEMDGRARGSGRRVEQRSPEPSGLVPSLP